MSLPSSNVEKDKEGGFLKPHWLYVHELRSLLDELEDTDWLTPNQVANLAVEREGQGMIAAIDFGWNEVDWFVGDDEGDDEA